MLKVKYPQAEGWGAVRVLLGWPVAPVAPKHLGLAQLGGSGGCRFYGVGCVVHHWSPKSVQDKTGRLAYYCNPNP